MTLTCPTTMAHVRTAARRLGFELSQFVQPSGNSPQLTSARMILIAWLHQDEGVPTREISEFLNISQRRVQVWLARWETAANLPKNAHAYLDLRSLTEGDEFEARGGSIITPGPEEGDTPYLWFDGQSGATHYPTNHEWKRIILLTWEHCCLDSKLREQLGKARYRTLFAIPRKGGTWWLFVDAWHNANVYEFPFFHQVATILRDHDAHELKDLVQRIDEPRLMPESQKRLEAFTSKLHHA